VPFVVVVLLMVVPLVLWLLNHFSVGQELERVTVEHEKLATFVK
jgi:hypothetical protein